MPTNITQVEDIERDKMLLRVEGELMFDDAILLEKIALDMRENTERNLTLDLSDLSLMDSESAPIIRRLQQEHGFEIEGLQLFLQKVIDEAENRSD